MVTLQDMRRNVEQKIGRRNLLMEQREKQVEQLAKIEELLDYTVKARVIIQTVAKNTQKNIEYHISNLVTMALSSVFPQPYEFQLRFVERRNTTEADLIFLKNGHETDDILNSGGGGVADIASLALRISLWSLNKTSRTFILDEPDKFLHNPKYQEKASEMMKELCDKLGIQIIMVSDQGNIVNAADNVVRIKNIKGESEIGEENG